jgi:hypothetical protein
MAMKLNIPRLDNWAVFNDVLVGESNNHPTIENKQRVMSNKCIKLDTKLGFAFCTDNEVWQLGKQSILGRYVDPITKRFY